ncbi:hypothetical protein EGI26_08685 [Lacihabitans sp. CCS-44]|nr:hypothetical protein [Lacihabitans sp. CCS-44]
MIFKSIIQRIAKKPSKIFLMDAFGAFLSTLFLSNMILLNSKLQLGIPPKTLFILAFVAASFSVYSFLCSFFAKEKWRFFLKIIVLSNSFYCILTVVLVFSFFNQLTFLEQIYFSGELFVLLFLIFFEWKILKTANLNNHNI